VDARLRPLLLQRRQPVADEPHLQHISGPDYQSDCTSKTTARNRTRQHAVPCCCSCETEPDDCATPDAAAASESRADARPPHEPV
jgi:hypothetical protein